MAFSRTRPSTTPLAVGQKVLGKSVAGTGPKQGVVVQVMSDNRCFIDLGNGGRSVVTVDWILA